MPDVPFLLGATVQPDRVTSTDYPFHLPLIRTLDLHFTSHVVFFVGENGTGKSTVIEALAVLCRLPVSSGSRNELAAKHGPDSASPLAPALRPAFRRRPTSHYQITRGILQNPVTYWKHLRPEGSPDAGRVETEKRSRRS